MSGLTSVDGLISGLNTSEIIDSLMAIERRSVSLLEAKRERYNTELLSYQTIESKLLAIRGSAEALGRAATFDARTATSSDTAALTATAAARSAAGTYDLTIASLARSHQIASQGFADTDTTSIGTGTFTIETDGVATELAIDASNCTLGGLRDAINGAGTGVQATIINDGGTVNPYRLMLTSTDTGLENAISVSSSLSGGTDVVFDANSLTEPTPSASNYYSGTASAGGSYTGTAGKTYTVRIAQAGAIDEATYQVSEDGGQTWGSEQTLSSTIDVYDDLNGSELGAQMNFTEGDFGAGDTFTMRAFVPTVQEAEDALVYIGSGTGRIEITSASNRITDALPGVTLNLLAADDSKTVRVEVQPDAASVREHITNLVTNFNGAVDYITENSGYDEENGAGIFLGNSAVMRVQAGMRTALLNPVAGTETYNSLYNLGLSMSDTGSLSLNSSTLDAALADNYEDVAKIFKTTGTSTNSKIEFVTASSSTVENTAGYEVDITQAATQGALTGNSIDDPAVSPLTIDSTNRQLIVTVNGATSGILQLTEKTYTSGADLAAEIQTRINDDSNIAATGGVSVEFVDEGGTGYFSIKSARYGSSSSVSLGEPALNANAALGLTGGSETQGTDVAGTINGEAAIGVGQLLTAAAGNDNTAGITLRVTLTPEEVAGDATGTVSIVKGVGTRLTETLNSYTDPIDGLLKIHGRQAESQIDAIDDSIERAEELLAARRQRLVSKFTAMETALSAMQQQSNFLAQQFAALSNQQSSS